MTEPVNFTLPKKPRVYQKDSMPDQRKIAVMPLKALTDQTLTDGSIRILGVLCSYCNRAGITWVSQARLAKDLNISRQAVTNQLMQLRAAGYVEIIKKGFRGERCNTLRVIFDSSVDAATAMAVTSSIEDTRPPAIKQEQAMEAETHPDLPCLVQNPYVRMLVGQTDLNGLQAADRPSGYPCLDQPVIVACRPLLTRGGGIQSSGICLQLTDPCHQDG